MSEDTKQLIDRLASLEANDAVRQVVTDTQEKGVGLFLNGKSSFFLPLSTLTGFNSDVGEDETGAYIAGELKKIVANAVGKGIVNFYRCHVEDMLQDYCQALSDGMVPK